jgi:hypothetical protein
MKRIRPDEAREQRRRAGLWCRKWRPGTTCTDSRSHCRRRLREPREKASSAGASGTRRSRGSGRCGEETSGRWATPLPKGRSWALGCRSRGQGGAPGRGRRCLLHDAALRRLPGDPRAFGPDGDPRARGAPGRGMAEPGTEASRQGLPRRVTMTPPAGSCNASTAIAPVTPAEQPHLGAIWSEVVWSLWQSLRIELHLGPLPDRMPRVGVPGAGRTAASPSDPRPGSRG